MKTLIEMRKCNKMTLIMMGISNNGIVASGDTRRTIQKPNENVRYLDTTIKVLKFHNFVINYANSAIIDGVLVGDWLIETIGDKKFHTPFDVFNFILRRLPVYLKNGDSDKSITFYCGMYVENSPMILSMMTFDKNIKIVQSSSGTASWDGSGSGLATAIFNCNLDIQWHEFNMFEMKNLFEVVGETVINIANLSKNQTIGGKILTEMLPRPVGGNLLK